MRHYFTYTRKKNNDYRYQDPDHILFEAKGLTIIETPFGWDRTYVCYVESDLTKINGVLNSSSEFNWKKYTLEKLTELCNDNIEHEAGQEFTNNGSVIIDNRIYPEKL